MPKRKRDRTQEKIDKYKRKIEEIEARQLRKRRRVVIETSSESGHTSEEGLTNDNEENNTDTPVEGPTTVEESNTLSEPSTDKAVTDLPDLDPELLSALGEETDNSPTYGEKIHHSLAQRWEPVLKKGLPKETKEKLLKDHLVPENCTLLQAPKLNVEVAAAVSETSRSRDKRKEAEQQQLGVGVSTISKAITTLLTSDNKIEAIKVLSDGCRILTDLHHQITQSRITLINYALAKPFLNVVQDSERDETLYGKKLSEKIKASKVIEKQGLQIKKYTKPQKTVSTEPPSNSRSQYQHGPPATNQGNWFGPSRFQQNRGGRRGQRRMPATTSSRRPPAPSTSAASQAKTRALSRP